MNESLGRSGSVPIGREEVAIDSGLRKFMLGVYQKMGLGLLWSAALAYAVGAIAPVTQVVLTPPVIYVVMWGPVALLLFSNLFMRSASPASSGFLYWGVVTLMGLGLGVWVFVAMNALSVETIGGRTLTVTFGGMTKAFLVTAASFGGLALWGYTTKRNLSGLHSLVIMASWGLALIVAVNFFMRSGPVEMIMQAAMLVVFALLVATQTNVLRETYYYIANDLRSQAVMTNYGALNLYIAFVSIFQIILSFLSSRE